MFGQSCAVVPRIDNTTQQKFPRRDPVADRRVFVFDRLSVKTLILTGDGRWARRTWTTVDEGRTLAAQWPTKRNATGDDRRPDDDRYRSI